MFHYFRKKRISQIISDLFSSDPYWDNVDLLLSMNGANNGTVFVEEHGLSLNASGTGVTSTAQVKFGSTSLKVGTSGPLTASAILGYGTSDFTLELWYYPLSQPTNYNFFTSPISANGIVFGYNGYGVTPSWGIAPAQGIWKIFSTTCPIVGQWNHLAVTRQAGTLRLFLNGLLLATVANDTTNFAASATYIGGNGTSAVPGYIDEVRSTKNYARYVSNFSVPSTAFYKGQNSLYDPYYSNVVFLSRMDDTYTDLCGHTISTVGTIQLTSNASRYGSTGLYSTGAGYLVTAASQDFIMPGAFTIEYWVNYPASGSVNPHSVISLGPYNAGVLIRNNTGDAVYVNGSNIGGGAVPFDGKWHHVAVTRDVSNMVRYYVDGVLRSSLTVSGVVNSSGAALYIGVSAHSLSERMVGYVDDIRISRDVARYTASAFTVPSFAVPYAQNTATSDRWWNDTLLSIKAGTLDGRYNKSFIDSSGTNQVTAVGTTSGSSLTPVSTEGSGSVFLGSANYLSIPSNAAFAFGTGDFTIEMFVYLRSRTAQVPLFDNRNGSGSDAGIALYLSASGSFGAWGNNAAIGTPGTAIVPTGQWVHLAVARQSGNLRFFVNGVLDRTTVSTYSMITNTLLIGKHSDSAILWLDGYVSNCRVVKGTALYTGDFAVPTVELSSVEGTSLLLKTQYTGIVNNYTFLDKSSSTLSITRVGNVSTSNSVLPTNGAGSGSAYFDGNGDYLQVPSSTNMSLSSGDFTIECWVNRTGTDSTYGKYPRIINASDTWNTNSSWCLTAGHYDWGWNQFGFHVYGQNANVSQMLQSTTVIQNGLWYHVAVTRQGNTFCMFVNGVLEATATWSGSMNSGTTNTARVGGLALAGGNNDFFNGYLSDLRVVKGTAVYTSNFSVPTAALTSISGTALLLDFASANIVDSTRRYAITVNGDARMDLQTKHNGVGAIYFDGNGDFLSIPYHDFEFGYSDWTLEAWVYPTASATYQDIISRRSSGTTGGGFLLCLYNLVPRMYVSATTGGSWDAVNAIGAPNAIGLNTWTHLAMVRSGGLFKLFVNGQLSAIAASSASLPVGTSTLPLCIGGGADGSEPFTGYMDDLRVTKAARYTTSFSPCRTEYLTVAQSSTTRDVYGDQVSMLVPFTSDLLDLKGNTFATTGTISIDTDGPYGNCGYFNGSSYLTSSANVPNLNFGYRDFTIELSVKPTGWTSSGSASLFGTRSGPGNSGFNLYMNAAHKFVFNYFTENSDSNAVMLTGSTVASLDTWYHLAVTKTGNVLRLYVNGKVEAIIRTTLGMYASTGAARIGAHSYGGSVDTTWAFIGKMYGLRATANVHRYLDSMTPAQMLTTPEVFADADPYWNNVVLSLEGYSFIDRKGHSVALTGNPGLSSTQSKFSKSSIYLDGAATKLTYSASSDWSLGHTYTIDLWMHPVATPGNMCRMILIGSNGTNSALYLGYTNTGALVISVPLGGTVSVSTPGSAIALNTWSHVAVCVQNGNATIYVNGVAQATGPVTTQVYVATNGLIVGYDTVATVNSQYKGYLQDVRITKGVCRYQGNFAVPTIANPTVGAAS